MQVNSQVKVNAASSEHNGRAGVVLSTDEATASSVVRLDQSTTQAQADVNLLDAELILLGT